MEEKSSALDLLPFRFTGKEKDAETGYHYYGARYYNAYTGRWLSSDPLMQRFNWYAYCNNNPMRYVDPSGKAWTEAMWWLCAVDGPVPVGDAVYVVGIIVEGAIILAQRDSRLTDNTPAKTQTETAPTPPTTPGPGKELAKAGKDIAKTEITRRLLEETKKLLDTPEDGRMNLDQWHDGSFNSPKDSLDYHFNKHGEEVRAKTTQDYLNKAISFKNNLKGAKKYFINGTTEGIIKKRYIKNNRYIDLAPDGSIIFFGSL